MVKEKEIKKNQSFSDERHLVKKKKRNKVKKKEEMGLYVIILIGRPCTEEENNYIKEQPFDDETAETTVTLNGFPVKNIGDAHEWYVIQHICGELNHEGNMDGAICNSGIDPSTLPKAYDSRFKLIVLTEWA